MKSSDSERAQAMLERVNRRRKETVPQRAARLQGKVQAAGPGNGSTAIRDVATGLPQRGPSVGVRVVCAVDQFPSVILEHRSK